MERKALVTGITGQDGSYLAELLIEEGYKVYGIQRRSSTIITGRIDKLLETGQLETYYGDLADTNSIVRLLTKIQPDEIYNMGSMSHVRVSFDVPEYTAQVTGLATLRILESMRSLGMASKFYQASSSEMFGISPAPQNENTPMLPQSPYGAAKLYAYNIVRIYRSGYGFWAANGILFNHESPRRGETFVTKKIVRAAVRIKMGKQKKVVLGNLSAKRDWGHARDYMQAVYQIMQHKWPDDFVVASGIHHSVEYFAVNVFNSLGLNFYDYLETNLDYYRPNEVPELLGDSTKIRETLGWQPICTLDGLIDDMVKNCWDEELK